MYIYIHTRYVCVCIPTGWGYTYRFTIYSPFWRSHAISSTLLWLLPTHTHTQVQCREMRDRDGHKWIYSVCVGMMLAHFYLSSRCLFFFTAAEFCCLRPVFFSFFIIPHHFCLSLFEVRWGNPKQKKKIEKETGKDTTHSHGFFSLRRSNTYKHSPWLLNLFFYFFDFSIFGMKSRGQGYCHRPTTRSWHGPQPSHITKLVAFIWLRSGWHSFPVVDIQHFLIFGKSRKNISFPPGKINRRI